MKGHGVAHEVHQKGPKGTKMHKNGHHSMTKQCFGFVLSDLYDFLWMKWAFERGQETVHEGVMGLRMRWTKMDQYAPKWLPQHDREKSFEFVLSD